jgi:hypothetical protein
MAEGRERAELTVRLENLRPVDITELGRMLQALGKEYEEFVVARFEGPRVNARLFVSRVETGSILLVLQTLLDQGSFILQHAEVFAGFMTNLHEIIDVLLPSKGVDAAGKKVPETITPASVERISTIVEPVAKDGGSNLTINVTVSGNTAPVYVQPIIISSERANALQNSARRFLGPQLPSSGSFKGELLQLHQMRGDIKAKTGDRGIIEKFSSKPVKLHFMTPEVKAAIVDQQDNPFRMAYVVDGEVGTIEGQPSLYKIQEVHDAVEKP